ncbi:response regulator [Vibrio mexicanus]|uniref:response regulator n=1 Tax=Vibrio mexicanus TaxID=1004326 RepID=UPI00307B9256
MGRRYPSEPESRSHHANQAGLASGYCQSCLEAVELCSKNEYDLILMDCHMPKMDGYEATRSIRALYTWAKQTPIIALTANVVSEDKQRCFDVGMTEFLSKPVTPNQLHQTLSQYLPNLIKSDSTEDEEPVLKNKDSNA